MSLTLKKEHLALEEAMERLEPADVRFICKALLRRMKFEKFRRNYHREYARERRIKQRKSKSSK
jgi:hypothetical protein